jgi:hypothetical protein
MEKHDNIKMSFCSDVGSFKCANNNCACESEPDHNNYKPFCVNISTPELTARSAFCKAMSYGTGIVTDLYKCRPLASGNYAH